MSLITLIVVVCLIGLASWGIPRVFGLPHPWPKICMAIGLVVVAFLVLKAFGILDDLRSVRVPQVGALPVVAETVA